MGKCKWCGKTEKANSFGYCEACNNEIRQKIAKAKNELEELERRAKLDLSVDEKQRIVDLTVQYRNELKVFKDKGVPFFKSDIDAMCDGIFAKMGVDYHFPIDFVALSKVKKRKSIPVIIGFAFCFLIIVSYAVSYADMRTKYIEQSKMTDEAYEIIGRHVTFEEELNKEIERLTSLVEPTEAPTIRAYTLQNGNFVSGKNFTPGIYNITALSGGGLVSSDNMYDGGINAIMGVEDDGFYQKQYKNISLPEGTTISIDGVKVRLTLVE